MEPCIFCQIIAGTIPSYKIYEDEKTIAFLDIKPVSLGHTLVLPKKHVANLEEILPEDLMAVMKTIQKIGKLLKTRLDVPGYNLIVNNDPVAGQEIPHLHFHLVPRRAYDGLQSFPQGSYEPGEAEGILKKLL